MFKAISTLAILICFALPVEMAASASWEGKEVTRDGKRHVLNPATPANPPVVQSTIELWRCGGEDEDTFLLGTVADIARDDDGNTYLLDSQQSTVHVIAANGEFLRSVGRAGDGPGEIRGAGTVMLFSDATLCVLQAMPARAVLFDTEGKGAGEQGLPRNGDGTSPFVLGGAIVDDELFLFIVNEVVFDNRNHITTSVVRVDRDGEIVETYWEAALSMNMATASMTEKAIAEEVWAVGADGRVFVNEDWDSYSVVIAGAGSAREFVVERDYEHRMRSDAEFAVAEQRLNRPGMPPIETSETDRDIVAIYPRPDGAMWILPSRGVSHSEGTIATLDSFDAEGRFNELITLQGPFRGQRDVFHFVGDFVYVLTDAQSPPDDDGKMSDGDAMGIICLALSDAPRKQAEK